jgi:hypothetical protein
MYEVGFTRDVGEDLTLPFYRRLKIDVRMPLSVPQAAH